MTKRRWRVTLPLAAAGLVAAFLLASNQQRSPWRVGFDFTNWRIHSSDSVEFNPDGKVVRSTKRYHVGPVTLSSQQAWPQSMPATLPGTNALERLRRISSVSTVTRKVTLVETVKVNPTSRDNLRLPLTKTLAHEKDAQDDYWNGEEKDRRTRSSSSFYY